MTTQVSLVDKRIRDGADDPMITTNNKRRKVIAATVTKASTDKTSTKVDPSELASAFALASLASISSSVTPRTDKKSKQEKEERVKNASSFEEARSPKPEEPPMSPEHRNSSSTEERSEAPKEVTPSIPSTPEDSDISVSRKVHYAPSGKHYMPSPAPTPNSMRSPPPPTPNPSRRLIVPARQMAPRPPIHMARPPPPPYMGPMNSGFTRFPSPRQAHHHHHMHPQHMFHPHSPHHPPLHHPHPHHPHHHHLQQSPHVQSPRGWYSAHHAPSAAAAAASHLYPPRSLMQPPLQHPENKPWICDHCNVAAFATYDEACSHEAVCQHRLSSNNAQRLRSASVDDERIGVEEAPSQPTKSASASSGAAATTTNNLKFYEGCRSLSMNDDKEWLSEINCFVRDYCIEVFSATADDVSRTSKRAGRLVQGQVGIRCKFCLESKEKSVGAVSFPTSVSGIYDAVKRWQRVHLEVCEHVPEKVRTKLNALANSNVWVPTTRQYWADSAVALGMVDTPDGIRFTKDPASKQQDLSKDMKMNLLAATTTSRPTTMDPTEHKHSQQTSVHEEHATTTTTTATKGQQSGDKYVVTLEDKGTIPPYVHFLMSQVEPCHFTEADRFVARSKGPVGYPGFQCRHCNGHAGLGKYFPVSAKSLATNSTSQNIHAHLLKCRKCPQPIKDQLVELKIQKSRSARMEPGWRKVFFDKIWARLHNNNNGVKNM